jgi:hypothetical protein
MKIKTNFYLWLWLLCTLPVTLQSQEVVTTSGGYAESTSAIITWTIGEPVTETICGTNSILTQGFNQGDLIITLVKNPEESGLILKIFPNPAHDRINISVVQTEIEDLRYVLTNINGKVLINNKLQSHKTDIPVSQLSPALYLLKIYNGRKEIGSYKIIKK